MDTGLKATNEVVMRCVENAATKWGKYDSYFPEKAFTDWQVDSEEWCNQADICASTQLTWPVHDNNRRLQLQAQPYR